MVNTIGKKKSSVKEKKQDLKQLTTAASFANYYKNQNSEEKKQLATAIRVDIKQQQKKLQQKNNQSIKKLRLLQKQIQAAEKKLKAVKDIPPVNAELKKQVTPVLQDFKELDMTTKKLAEKSMELKQTHDITKKAKLLGEVQQIQEKRDFTLANISQFLKENRNLIYVVLAMVGTATLTPHVINLIKTSIEAFNDITSGITWFAVKIGAIITGISVATVGLGLSGTGSSGSMIFSLLKKSGCWYFLGNSSLCSLV